MKAIIDISMLCEKAGDPTTGFKWTRRSAHTRTNELKAWTSETYCSPFDDRGEIK